jgi:hypothetical protein
VRKWRVSGFKSESCSFTIEEDDLELDENEEVTREILDEAADELSYGNWDIEDIDFSIKEIT